MKKLHGIENIYGKIERDYDRNMPNLNDKNEIIKLDHQCLNENMGLIQQNQSDDDQKLIKFNYFFKLQKNESRFSI